MFILFTTAQAQKLAFGILGTILLVPSSIPQVVGHATRPRSTDAKYLFFFSNTRRRR